MNALPEPRGHDAVHGQRVPGDVGDALGQGLAMDGPDGVEGVLEEGGGEEGLVPVPARGDEVSHPGAAHAALAAS